MQALFWNVLLLGKQAQHLRGQQPPQGMNKSLEKDPMSGGQLVEGKWFCQRKQNHSSLQGNNPEWVVQTRMCMNQISGFLQQCQIAANKKCRFHCVIFGRNRSLAKVSNK